MLMSGAASIMGAAFIGSGVHTKLRLGCSGFLRMFGFRGIRVLFASLDKADMGSVGK